MPTIDYYLTLISPWAFLGAAEFAAIAKETRRDGQRKALQVWRGLRENSDCRCRSDRRNVVPIV